MCCLVLVVLHLLKDQVSYDYPFFLSTLFFQHPTPPLWNKDIIRQPSEDEIIKLAPPPKKAWGLEVQPWSWHLDFFTPGTPVIQSTVFGQPFLLHPFTHPATYPHPLSLHYHMPEPRRPPPTQATNPIIVTQTLPKLWRDWKLQKKDITWRNLEKDQQSMCVKRERERESQSLPPIQALSGSVQNECDLWYCVYCNHVCVHDS